MAAEDKKWINSQDALKKNERKNTDKPKERKRSILQESIKRSMSDLPGEELERQRKTYHIWDQSGLF